MIFLELFTLNVLVSFLLAALLVIVDSKYKKNLDYFVNEPVHLLDKMTIAPTKKFKIETIFMSILLPVSFSFPAILSYLLTTPLQIEKWQFFLMVAYAEVIVLVMMGVILKMAYMMFIKKFPKDQVLTVYFDDRTLYMPVTPLEGLWRETARRAKKHFVQLKYEDIAELIVQPSRGTYRPIPSYYKIILKDNPLPLFFKREQFYGQEKRFLDKVTAKIPKLTIMDQLRDE